MTPARWRIAVACWLVSLSWLTGIRCRVWHDDLALWTDAVAKAPLKPRPTMNLGRSYELRHDAVRAEAMYRRVIGLSWDERRPAYMRRFSLAAAETNIAHLEMNAGHFASAMRILDQTLAGWPEFPYAHYNKGAIFWVYGACDDARAEYAMAFRWDQSLPIPKGTCGPSLSTP